MAKGKDNRNGVERPRRTLISDQEDLATDLKGRADDAARSLAQAVAQRKDFEAHERRPQKSSHTPAERLARVFGEG